MRMLLFHHLIPPSPIPLPGSRLAFRTACPACLSHHLSGLAACTLLPSSCPSPNPCTKTSPKYSLCNTTLIRVSSPYWRPATSSRGCLPRPGTQSYHTTPSEYSLPPGHPLAQALSIKFPIEASQHLCRMHCPLCLRSEEAKT